jgi:hypothetical protein
LRPTVLTQRGAEVLVQIERLMDAAGRALAAGTAVSALPADAGPRTEALAAASPPAAGAVRGN